MMEAKIRKPAVAGQFYAGDTRELRHDLKECFLQCKASPLKPVQAIIVPHAGYVFSGVPQHLLLPASNQTHNMNTFSCWDLVIMFILTRLR